MTYKGAKAGLMGAVMAASLLVFAPSVSAARATDNVAKTKTVKKKPRSAGYFVGAPAAADAHRAALFELAGGGYDGFRFTPSGGANGRAITVAIRARATGRVAPATNASTINTISAGLQASAYSLGASVGWKHFALSGDLAKVDGGAVPESRELADIGVSYAGRNWSTRLLLGAERATGNNPVTRIVGGTDAAMSVDLGGSYSLTRNLELNGGVRYKSQVDRNDLTDQRRDSQAVYVGTAFRF
jgi:hypothetical protein